MKTGRWVWAAIGAACAVISIILVLIIKWGVHVGPIGLMKPSFFSQPEEIGKTVFERIYPELERLEPVIWGSQPGSDWYEKAAIGFLQTAQSTGVRFQKVIVDPEMNATRFVDAARQLGLSVEVLKFNGDDSQLHSLELQLAENPRTMVYTAGIYSTGQIFGNPMARFRAQVKLPVLTVVAAPLSRSYTEEDRIEPRCVGIANDQQGTRDLGCFLLRTSRAIYRKKIQRDRFVAVLNQEAYSRDFVLQIAPPDFPIR